MAIYNKYIASLNVTLEYDSKLQTVKTFEQIEHTEFEGYLGKMTDQGLQLERRSEVAVKLKAICDRLWSKEHITAIAKDKEAKQLLKQKKVTTELLQLRLTANVDAKSLEVVEIKTTSNGKGRVSTASK